MRSLPFPIEINPVHLIRASGYWDTIGLERFDKIPLDCTTGGKRNRALLQPNILFKVDAVITLHSGPGFAGNPHVPGSEVSIELFDIAKYIEFYLLHAVDHHPDSYVGIG